MRYGWVLTPCQWEREEMVQPLPLCLQVQAGARACTKGLYCLAAEERHEEEARVREEEGQE